MISFDVAQLLYGGDGTHNEYDLAHILPVGWAFIALFVLFGLACLILFIFVCYFWSKDNKAARYLIKKWTGIYNLAPLLIALAIFGIGALLFSWLLITVFSFGVDWG